MWCNLHFSMDQFLYDEPFFFDRKLSCSIRVLQIWTETRPPPPLQALNTKVHSKMLRRSGD
jgi:hypothetical protein